MKLKATYLALLVVCVVMTFGGCANRNARSAESYTSSPHLYPATRYALRGEVAQHWVDRVPPSQSSGYWLFPSDFMKVLVMEILAGTTGYVYSVVVEVPISLAVDTVLIPMDVKQTRAFKRRSDYFTEALLGEEWPVSPETLRQYYQPGIGDEPIRELVERPASPHYRARIETLAEAGIGLLILANSPAMDNELGMRLVERARSPDQPTFLVFYQLVTNPATPVATLLTVARTDNPGILGVHRYLAEDSRSTPEILVALLDAPEEREHGYPMPEREALLWRAVGHPAHTPDSLQRYAEKGGALSQMVARHPSATAPVLETVLERAIEARSYYVAEPVSVHPQATATLLHRLVAGLIGPMVEETPETLNADDLFSLSGFLYNVSSHPAADRRTLDVVLLLTAKVSGMVDPQNQRTLARIEQIRLKVRERRGPESGSPLSP